MYLFILSFIKVAHRAQLKAENEEKHGNCSQSVHSNVFFIVVNHPQMEAIQKFNNIWVVG